MKTLPILFYTSLVFLFNSCEVPKEKVIEKEVVVKSVDTITKKEEKFRQNDYVSENLKKIYETYGCLNKDNFQSNGFDEYGKEKFILYVNGKFFNLKWVCDSKRCWLNVLFFGYYLEFSCSEIYNPNSYFIIPPPLIIPPPTIPQTRPPLHGGGIIKEEDKN